jgi:prepilin-type N-terminal cleavage/methylation domain-containing protein
MKTRNTTEKKGFAPPEAGFTLIEILVVIAIIAILASILVPVAGGAKETALKRRAALEMQSIKMAALQFQSDHRYMPWPPEGAKKLRVGDDKWATDESAQLLVMELLTGSNAMKKVYLQIPEKSRKKDKNEVNPPMRFLDPWGQPYVIGMDRNMDGAVTTANVDPWSGKTVVETVLVYSSGPTGKNKPLKTFDVMQ